MGLLRRVSNVSILGRTFYAVHIKSSYRKQLVGRFVQWAQDYNSAFLGAIETNIQEPQVRET